MLSHRSSRMKWSFVCTRNSCSLITEKVISLCFIDHYRKITRISFNGIAQFIKRYTHLSHKFQWHLCLLTLCCIIFLCRLFSLLKDYDIDVIEWCSGSDCTLQASPVCFLLVGLGFMLHLTSLLPNFVVSLCVSFTVYCCDMLIFVNFLFC